MGVADDCNQFLLPSGQGVDSGIVNDVPGK
jgi:hypothetical protein